MININIKLNNLTEPVNRLLKMIDDVYVQPSSIKRIAKAEAYAIERTAKAEHEAQKIKTNSEIELGELQFRAAHRFLSEQTILQGNLENTIKKSIPYLDENATPEDIDKDWLFNYLVNCQMVSDSEMQEMWAKILAGEANEPGSFSKRTVNHMINLTKNDAELIESLCDFTWIISDKKIDSIPLILSYDHEIYTMNNIDYWKLKYLEELNIIDMIDRTFLSVPLKMKVFPLENKLISYHGREMNLRVPAQESRYDDNIHRISLGYATFTSIGVQISKICNTKTIDGFYEYVENVWHNEFTTKTPDEIQRKHNQ